MNNRFIALMVKYVLTLSQPFLVEVWQIQKSGHTQGLIFSTKITLPIHQMKLLR